MTGIKTTAEKQQIFVRKKSSGVALILLDVPGKVNLLTQEAMDQFEVALASLERDSDVKAIAIVSGKPDTFVTGADLHELIKLTEASQALAVATRGQQTLDKLSAVTKPTVAGINGVCLGGGLELALACDKRIATDEKITELGLPEVRLGFVPGLGGTQRLPRLIGVKAAVEMILTAKTITAHKALELGLIDQLVKADHLLDAVEAMALELSQTGKPAPSNKALEEMTPEKRKSFFAMSERVVRIRTKGHYPAQTRALEVIQKGLNEGLSVGLKAEAQAFAELSVTEVSRNLVFLFFTTEFIRLSALNTYQKTGASKLTTIGIVGGGMMGTALAQVAALSGLRVMLKTVHDDRQKQVVDKLKEVVDRSESEGRKGEIVSASDFEALREADVIIEASAEDEQTKKAVLEKISQIAKKDCLIATNTSSLSVGKLADYVTDKKCFLGLHFFHPVEKMPLVELVPQNATSREAIGKASGFVCNLGKMPVSVKDSPSFLVNRLVSFYLGQAARLALQNHPLNWIEEACLDFGMPMPPFMLADEIGLDVTYYCARALENAFGPRMAPPLMLKQMIEVGLLGKKSGRGIYYYNESGKKLDFEPKLFSALTCIVSDEKADQAHRTSLAESIILPMIDEAARCLDERVVRRPREIDLCAVLGMGFPPFRGGLLRYADSLSMPSLIEKLERIYWDMKLDVQVSAHLKKLDKEGRAFYTRGAGDEQ